MEDLQTSSPRPFRVRPWMVAAVGALAVLAVLVPNVYQQAAPELPVKIDELRVRFVRSNASMRLGDQGSARASRGEWGKIDIRFSTAPEWLDEVEFRVYVLMHNYGRRVTLTGRISCVFIKKGSRHYACAFVCPSAIERFGGRVEAVAVEAWVNNRLSFVLGEPGPGREWWKQYTTVSGAIVPWFFTPLDRRGIDDYETVKAP